MKKIVLLSLFALLSIPFSLCAQSDKSPGKSASVLYKGRGKAKTMETKKIASAYSQFGLELIKRLEAKNDSMNIVISPASIALALTMTLNGADGETYDAMANVLKIKRMNIDEANRLNAELLDDLSAAMEGIELRIANSLWARRKIQFKKQFIETNGEFYGAVLRELDFSSPSAPKEINEWVKEKTEGKIPSIIDRIEPNDILFLINAIYFNGSWAREFDESLTKIEIFHSPDGETKVPMMRRTGDFSYLEGEGFQAVMLPYVAKRLAMFIFLPAESSSLDEFYRNTTAERLYGWIRSMGMRKGEVIIPKFKFEYGASLKNTLSTMGMGIAFDRASADFRKMVDMRGVNAFIGDVVHKAFIDVNERGTEAAASTAVRVGLTAVRVQPEPFTFKADRPFFFVIRDNRSGLILFAGSIFDPSRP